MSRMIGYLSLEVQRGGCIWGHGCGSSIFLLCYDANAFLHSSRLRFMDTQSFSMRLSVVRLSGVAHPFPILDASFSLPQ
jgi:hypothetical protein